MEEKSVEIPKIKGPLREQPVTTVDGEGAEGLGAKRKD